VVDESALDELRRHPAICGMNANDRTIVAIHQPNYIPWLGYFFKIAHADKFVFLDTVGYSHGSFVNRNSIKTPNGPAWLTIPILKSGRSGQLIGEVEPDNVYRWEVRHLATLRSNYGRAEFFKEIFALLEPHYCDTDNRKSLADFNIGLICAVAAYLGISPQFIRSSQLNVSGRKTDLLLDICCAIGATAYLAGGGSRCYQEDVKFEDAGITPVYSPFAQRRYPQLFGDFIGNLSVVDILMNCGYLGTRRLLGIEPDAD
jgi:hypothetical protein